MTDTSINPGQDLNAFEGPAWRGGLEAETQKQLAELRILIVDDNWFARSLLRNVLQAMGVWKLVECLDPEEGFKRLQDEHFDLVLTDNHMPGMTGMEFTRLIRTSEKTGNHPFRS